jgi:hypothetical protein
MIATKPITNTEDTIDTRDILERINWLEPQEPELYEDDARELETLRHLMNKIYADYGEEIEGAYSLFATPTFLHMFKS